MAEILNHPDAFAKEKPFDFPDGSSIMITAAEGDHLTVSKAVYMLEDVKYRILQMMRDP